MMRITAMILALVSLTACQALHTEREPQELFQQIPAWDGAANRICCGHLRECQPWQSPRC